MWVDCAGRYRIKTKVYLTFLFYFNSINFHHKRDRRESHKKRTQERGNNWKRKGGNVKDRQNWIFLLNFFRFCPVILKDFLVAEVDEDLAESLLGRLVADGQVDGADAQQDGQQERLFVLGFQLSSPVIELSLDVES